MKNILVSRLTYQLNRINVNNTYLFEKMLDRKNMDAVKAQNMRLSIIHFFERRVSTLFEKFSVNVSPTTGETLHKRK